MADQQAPRHRKIRSLDQILLDLHRCEHGRQQGDPCFGCEGQSTGNLLLQPGTIIGHTMDGRQIVVPSWEDHNDPEKWVEGHR